MTRASAAVSARTMSSRHCRPSSQRGSSGGADGVIFQSCMEPSLCAGTVKFGFHSGPGDVRRERLDLPADGQGTLQDFDAPLQGQATLGHVSLDIELALTLDLLRIRTSQLRDEGKQELALVVARAVVQ